MTTRRRTILAFMAFALVATACRRPATEVELGVQRIALSLAFSEEELVVPVEPEVIIQLIPAPPQTQPEDLVIYEIREVEPERPVFTFEPDCPEAAPGAAPKKPVQFQVVLPPEEGRYLRVNDGFVEVTGGVIPLRLPYPKQSVWIVEHLPDAVTPGIDGFTEDTFQKTWSVRKIVVPGFEIIDHLRLTGTQIKLDRRTTLVNGVESVFEPSPQPNLYVFGTEGDTWTSAGVDTATNAAMVVSGTVLAREPVDACGEVVDTYSFSLDEQWVNLTTGETAGTNAGEPNIYNIATQYGGFMVREDVNMVQTITTEDGTPLSVQFDYVSVNKGIEPEAVE